MTVVLTDEERKDLIDKIIDLLVELEFWELTDETSTDPHLYPTIPLVPEITEIVI